MKRTDLIRHIKKHGCKLRREGNKHSVYENTQKALTSTVPRHTDINEFLAKKICKDLGIAMPTT